MRGRSGRTPSYPPPVLPQQGAAAAGGCCRLPLTAARPVLPQQGAAAAGRSAAGSSCRYRGRPYPRRRAAAVAHNAALCGVRATAVPRLRITTRYVPGAPAGAEGTQQQPLPPVAHPHRVAGGGAGGGVALATVRRCHCTAAVAAHIERSQRCQLPPAGAAAATWGHEARQPAGAG